MGRKTLYLVVSFFILTSGPFAAEDLKGAFSEGEFTGQIRTYYYERDFDDRKTRQDIAAGGLFYYRTAPLHGFTGGMAFYTAQAMNMNDDDKDVYGLLASDAEGDHESFSVLGEAFIQYSGGSSSLKIGRQELETPWINTDDNRLTPQSTDTVLFTNSSIPGLEIFAANVKRMRGKTATEFESMSEYAGLAENEPVSFAGLVYSGIENLKLQLWDYYAHEYLNGIYFKTDFSAAIADNVSGFCTYQHLLQKDTGDRIGGELDTYLGTLETGVEVQGLTLALAYGQVGDDGIHYPWGHDIIISGQLNDIGRAEETGFHVKVAYDFSQIGINGLSGKVLYMDFNTPENGDNASPDYYDIDLDLKYKFSGCLDGLKLRLRHAIINEDEDMGGEDYTDSRIYITYDFNI